jgi:hypothetical protein
MLQLRSSSARLLQVGSELHLNYGAKSNGELLL